MKPSWLVLPLILFAAPLRALEMPIEIFEYVDNTRVVAFVTASDLEQSPEWAPFEGAPPLELGTVMEKVRKQIESDSRLEGANVIEVQLRRVPHHVREWHYMVKLETVNDDKAELHYMVVLMNGQVIPAMKEPEALK